MRVARMLLSMAIAASIFGCNEGNYKPSSSAGACGVLRSQLTIQDRMSQTSFVFSVGEPIIFSLSIANNSPGIVRLTPAGCGSVNYKVFDSAQRSIWDTAGIPCFAAAPLVVFQPYEQQTFSWTWDQLTVGGMAMPGAYTVDASPGNFIVDANGAMQLDCQGSLNASAAFRIQ